MNKIKIVESEPLITQMDIRTFENNFNKELPENYKQLLLKFNGGLESEGDRLLDTLYSLKYGNNTVEVAVKIHQILEKNIPLAFLPIGNTGTGNERTLCIEGDDLGKIFLFRHDELLPDLVANSLEELFGVNHIDEL